VQTLEAALYCLLNTRTFAQCALMAVNLGDETCAVASLACSLAGLVYGPAGIPAKWLLAIPGRGDMESLCGRLFEETVLRA
jgi:ADP-ribosyl-[dinitrogen reductase] hydrolase